jgi:hypothetical protein
MKSIDKAEAATQLVELLEMHRSPIVIRREGTDLAVLMSFAAYTTLRDATVHDFLNQRRAIAAEAEGNGLTADVLSDLLSGD